jgi:predicted transcriptional regulator
MYLVGAPRGHTLYVEFAAQCSEYHHQQPLGTNMFEFFRARATDAITSFKAADSIKDVAKMHQEVIVACLQRFGPLGKDGIAKQTGLESNQVARRLSELEKMDLIELTGNKVQSLSGRAEREWRIKPVQQELL